MELPFWVDRVTEERALGRARELHVRDGRPPPDACVERKVQPVGTGTAAWDDRVAASDFSRSISAAKSAADSNDR